MCNVARGETCCPLREFVVDEIGVAFIGFVQEIVDDDDGSVFRMRFKPVIISKLSIFVVTFAVGESNFFEGGGCVVPYLNELRLECFREASLGK